jgi:hypothetical protein
MALRQWPRSSPMDRCPRDPSTTNLHLRSNAIERRASHPPFSSVLPRPAKFPTLRPRAQHQIHPPPPILTPSRLPATPHRPPRIQSPTPRPNPRAEQSLLDLPVPSLPRWPARSRRRASRRAARRRGSSWRRRRRASRRRRRAA